MDSYSGHYKRIDIFSYIETQGESDQEKKNKKYWWDNWGAGPVCGVQRVIHYSGAYEIHSI